MGKSARYGYRLYDNFVRLRKSSQVVVIYFWQLLVVWGYMCKYCNKNKSLVALERLAGFILAAKAKAIILFSF